MNGAKIIKIELKDYFLLDKLNTLAAEYTTTTDVLINAAIQRLLDDIEFVRALRAGQAKLTYHPDGKI